MARFQFKLEQLRQLRESTRDERRASLAEAFRAKQILKQRQETMSDELRQSQDAQRALMAAGRLDVNRAIEQQRFRMSIESNQATLAQQSAALETEVERRRLALVEADREVRLLDKLEERQKAEHARRQSRKETQELDEVAARGHWNSRKQAAQTEPRAGTP